jgi:microcystin-dependent protein
MTFNATLSPNLDLGLGGIIGGLAGGFGANALSVGLGAGGLATGIAALAMSRQSGGINPSVFQTVNGTSQLQYSTLGASDTTILTLTDSLNPDTTPGNPINVSTFINAGTYCVRTISDPLNLPNPSGTSGLGIQGFSQWRKVYEGNTQLIGNHVSSMFSGNSIDFGNTPVIPGVPNSPMIFNTGANTGANVGYFQFNGAILGTTLGLGPTYGSGGNGDINAEQAELAQTIRVPETYTSTIFAYDQTTQNFLSTLNIFPGLITSTITVSSFTIGNAQFRNLNASTINTSSLNATGVISYNTQTGDSINTRIFNATQSVGTTALTAQSIGTQSLTTPTASISSLTSQQLINVSSVNGVVYPPPAVVSTPPGAIIIFAGDNLPAGYLLCDGSYVSQVTYVALFNVIGINYGGQFAGQFAVPDLRTRTVFGASSPNYFTSEYAPFSMVATTFTSVITEFPGGVAPNGITGRQALAVQSLQPGYELAVGMRVNANTGADQTVRVIIDILNYPGNFGQGGAFSYPNFPIIILNSPFTIDLPYTPAPTFTVTPVAPYRYTMGFQTSANFTTQTQYQVAGHTHTTLQPGGQSSQISGGQNRSGDPNTSGPQTSLNTQNYNYVMGSVQVGVPATVYNIPTSMATTPSAIALNYLIKT